MSALYAGLGTQLLWLARRLSSVVGWWALALLVVCLLAGVNLARKTAEYQQQALYLTTELRQLSRQSVTGATVPAAQTMPTAQMDTQQREAAELAAMLAHMPALTELSSRMLQIAALAHKHHIPLNVGDYQWQPVTTYQASHVQQFDMRFMIQTDYQTCRRFIAEVLQRYPTMALSGLELRKNETVQPTIEATLTFSVLMRGLDANRD